jgi:uncharacterized membrane protein
MVSDRRWWYGNLDIVENVLKELGGIGGKVLTTSLSHTDEAILQDALRAARS